MSVSQFSFIWILLLLAALFGLCEAITPSDAESNLYSNSHMAGRYRRNSDQANKSALTEPGIIVGIIVGVSGVLVVVGVAVLLCRLFCCKEATCGGCPCCKEEETYLEAGTVPIKIPSEDSPPDRNISISTVSKDRPAQDKPWPGTKKTPDTTAVSLPQYDDVPDINWKRNDFTEKKQIWESDAEKQSPYSRRRSAENSVEQPADDSDIPNDQQAFRRGRRKEKTPTRRKLTYGEDNPDVSRNSGDFTPLEHEPKKRNMEVMSQGRELSGTSHKHRKRHFQPSHDENRVTTTVLERNPQLEVNDGREFPLLEYEPGKRSVGPSYPDNGGREFREHTHGADREIKPTVYPRRLQNVPILYPEDTAKPREDFSGHDDRESRPVEYAPQPQPRHQQPYPEHRGRTWGEEERRADWDHTEIRSARAPISFGRNAFGGRDNIAFNQDSTETSV